MFYKFTKKVLHSYENVIQIIFIATFSVLHAAGKSVFRSYVTILPRFIVLLSPVRRTRAILLPNIRLSFLCIHLPFCYTCKHQVVVSPIHTDLTLSEFRFDSSSSLLLIRTSPRIKSKCYLYIFYSTKNPLLTQHIHFGTFHETCTSER